MLLEPADHELSDSEISTLFGGLFAVVAQEMRTDVTYLCEIAEAAAEAHRQREKRREAKKTRKQRAAEAREKRDAELCARFLAGETFPQLSSAFGISLATVHRVVTAAGIDGTQVRQSRVNAKHERIRSLRMRGLTVTEIAEETGIRQTTVGTILADLGLGARVRSKKWDQQNSRIWNLKQKGLTNVQIAQIVGTTKSTVGYRLRKMQADADTKSCQQSETH